MFELAAVFQNLIYEVTWEEKRLKFRLCNNMEIIIGRV